MPRLSRFLLGVAAMAVLGVNAAVHAGATFQINILDGPGEGFNDAGAPDFASTAGGNAGDSLGAQRRFAFAYAADIWADQLNSDVPILVGVAFDPLPCGPTEANLGAAGTNTVHRDFIGAAIVSTWYPAALANAQAGADLAPDIDDINARFNSAIDDTNCAFPRKWYYGIDGNPPAGTIDFVSIVLHELAHGLGFQTFMNTATGAKLSGLDDAFLLWLEDHSADELLAAMAADTDRAAASVNTGNLHWVGPDVIAAGGALVAGRHPSGHVEMYAPNPLEPGSSVSHFSTALDPDELMEPSFTGANHDVGLALELLRDIGWSTAVPSGASAGGSSSDGGGGGCFIDTITGPLEAPPLMPSSSPLAVAANLATDRKIDYPEIHPVIKP